MKYLCLVYLDEKKLETVADHECKACVDALQQSGHHIRGSPAIGSYGNNRAHSQWQNGGHRRSLCRDQGATRRVLPHRRQGPE